MSYSARICALSPCGDAVKREPIPSAASLIRLQRFYSALREASIRTQIKAGVIRLLAHFGYGIVPLSRYMPRDLAHHLRALFQILSIDYVLDVGANIGQYRDFLRDEVGYGGPIASFEPVRASVEQLRARARLDSNWIIHHCALGADNVTRAINVMTTSDLSSFLDPDASATKLFSPFNIVDHTELVTVRTLDSVMDEIRAQRTAPRAVYLKLDTQGYDLEVLKGAKRHLPEIPALQTELSCQRIYRGMPGYLDVLTALNDHNYQISGMFPGAQDTLLRVIESDCVMVNGALAKDGDLRFMWTK